MRSSLPLLRSLAALALLPAVVSAQSGITTYVAPGGALYSAFSENGRYVATTWSDWAATPGDTNGELDVFVIDTYTNAIERVSLSSTGQQTTAESRIAAISPDGRLVAFTSRGRLVPGLAAGIQRLYLRDRATGQTTCLSVNSAGEPANADSSEACFSADNRFAVFMSFASNLVAGAPHGTNHVYLRDLQTGQTTCVSRAPSGAFANSPCRAPAISADGNTLAYVSRATNLAPGDSFLRQDVFLFDRTTGTTSYASVSSAGVLGDRDSDVPKLSADGRFVAFSSRARNLVPGDTNLAEDAFVHDRLTAQTTRVSVDSSGGESTGYTVVSGISADGRFVAFYSSASTLAPLDLNGTADVFVHDRLTGQTSLESRDSAGLQTEQPTTAIGFSSDGRFVLLTSWSGSLAPGGVNGNGNLYLRQIVRGAATYGTAGTSVNGCTPAISAIGTPSASAGSGFTLTLDQIDGGRLAMLAHSVTGAIALPFAPGSSSVLSLRPPLQRLSMLASGGSAGQCDGALSLDWNAFMTSNAGALGNPRYAGQVIAVQGWVRDPAAPGGATLSQGFEFPLQP
jgi:Tol biopolymer transport system component